MPKNANYQLISENSTAHHNHPFSLFRSGGGRLISAPFPLTMRGGSVGTPGRFRSGGFLSITYLHTRPRQIRTRLKGFFNFPEGATWTDGALSTCLSPVSVALGCLIGQPDQYSIVYLARWWRAHFASPYGVLISSQPHGWYYITSVEGSMKAMHKLSPAVTTVGCPYCTVQCWHRDTCAGLSRAPGESVVVGGLPRHPHLIVIFPLFTPPPPTGLSFAHQRQEILWARCSHVFALSIGTLSRK